ncbi:unnamed protein product [Onchocerca flexuosa]|uniref:Inner membrane protein n=1 Tax=Onchocerca flexuosa TaxID=387005 RepID=A0A183I8A9_9BILA|nr:unnamed protein product [Onchocerca flexuosa]
MAAVGEKVMKRLIQLGATMAIGAGVVSKALYNGFFSWLVFSSLLFLSEQLNNVELSSSSLIGTINS